MRKLAAIPAGKPSGMWAQAIGLALQQRWREHASYAQIRHVGEDKHLTVRTKPFSRRELLDLFPPKPSVDDVLGGPHPLRAQQYWREAIKILQRIGLVGYYRELTVLPARRQGWGDAWLDQPLDIRPSKDDTAAVAEIATTARARKKALAARRRSTSPAPG